MGKQAVDGDANQVGQMLAAKLGWPQATFAASVELAGDKASLTVGREVDGGVEYKKVPLQSVITVDLRIVAPRAVKNGVTPESHNYSGEGARLPSLKGIMAAKKKPMTKAQLADYGAAPAPVVQEQSVTLPPPRAAGQIVADIPTLVKKLADEAKVL
jgi:electron transfer flavoprotein beta subunit